MIRTRRNVPPALLAFCFLASAAAVAAEPASDERVYRIGGEELLFGEQVERGVTDDPRAVQQFRRLGMGPACGIYNKALKRITDARASQFRPLLVAAARRQVPAEILSGENGPVGWSTVPVEMRKRRIENDLETNGADLFSSARAELLNDFAAQAESELAVSDDAATAEFANWDLDRPLAKKTACMLLRVGRPEDLVRRKAVFDGFFTRMRNQ